MTRLGGWLRLKKRQAKWLIWESQAVIGGSATANPYGQQSKSRRDNFRDDGFPR